MKATSALPAKVLCQKCSQECLISQLDARELGALQEWATAKTFPKKSVIFAQGDPGYGCYMLCSGRVKLVRRTRKGRCQYLMAIERGGFFGLDGLVNPRYGNDARTIEECRVLWFHPRAFALGATPWTRALISQLLRQNLDLGRRLSVMMGRGGSERLVYSLLELHRRGLHPTCEELAAYSNVSVRRASQIIQHLRDLRFTTNQNGHGLFVADPEGLRGFLDRI